MSWIGQADSPTSALVEISRLRQVQVERLTIPSQRRYVQYFSAMLDGSRPHLRPVVLRRVILNSVPCLESGGSAGSGGCRPFLQLFRAGRLVFSSLWRDAERGRGLPFVTCDEGSIKFDVDTPLQGDVLLRCRHVAGDRSRVSMFRAAFHTGFVQDGMLRFPRSQLDGAAEDGRFAQDFFVELIFSGLGGGGDAPVRAHPRGEESAQLADKETRVLDQFLAAESDFWRQVNTRRNRRHAGHRGSPGGRRGAAETRRTGGAGGGQAGAAFAIEDSEQSTPEAKRAAEPAPAPAPATTPATESQSGAVESSEAAESSEGAGSLQEFARLESELGLALAEAGEEEGPVDAGADVEDYGEAAEGGEEEEGEGGEDDDAFLAMLDQEMADLGIDNDM